MSSGRLPLREAQADVTTRVEREKVQAVCLASEKAACPNVEALPVGPERPADGRMHDKRDALGFADLFDTGETQHGSTSLTRAIPQVDALKDQRPKTEQSSGQACEGGQWGATSPLIHLDEPRG